MIRLYDMKTPSKYLLDTGLSITLLSVLLFHYSNFFADFDNNILIGVSIIGLLPVLWSIYQSLRKREWVSMDLLASIALIFSLLSKEWTSAIFIELMLSAARILGDITRDRTEKSFRGLLKLCPETARVERNGKLVLTPLKDIRTNDIVVVDIEERIPVDGIIISGQATIDESSLTGESLPVDKTKGDTIFSSTLIQSGSLRIQTTHVGKDTTIERVIKLVESAREEKPNTQTLSEKFGKFYIILILVGSILLYVLTNNLPLVLAVVLVVCADDVAIAVPIAYLRAIRAAASIGVIVKGSKHLETFGQTKTIVFDKTGTLTTGTLAVAEIVVTPGHDEQEVLEAAMLAGIRSNHPISKAIIACAKQKGIAEIFPDSVEEYRGKGLIAKKSENTVIIGRKSFLEELKSVFPSELLSKMNSPITKGKTVSFIAKNGQVIGFATAADKIKDNAKDTIDELRRLGIERIVMLTGDNEEVAGIVAKNLNIDEWHANLLPEDKVEIIKRLQENDPVAMVGDGVNDAGALSISGVGIAMGGLGTEGTIESAQIVLMRDDLSTLPATIRIAQIAKRISIQDFWIWGITNATGLALVFGGIIGPTGAAAYNFLSDFLPLGNSIRVKVIK